MTVATTAGESRPHCAAVRGLCARGGRTRGAEGTRAARDGQLYHARHCFSVLNALRQQKCWDRRGGNLRICAGGIVYDAKVRVDLINLRVISTNFELQRFEAHGTRAEAIFGSSP